MSVAVVMSGAGGAGGAELRVAQRECRALFGCKGPRAAEWLAAQGLTIPPAPNTWAAGPDTAVVARLGASEFFIEEGAPGDQVSRLAAAFAAARPAGVYPVLREDWSFTLSGQGTEDLLAQVCNVHFAALDLAAAPVILTLMVGVAVLILPLVAGNGRTYRIWCDPTFGPYLGAALRGVALESGGTYRGMEQ